MRRSSLVASPESPASEPVGSSAGWRGSPYVVLLLVLVMATSACSKQDPEVSVNDQVPAAQRVEEAPEGAEEGGEGEGGGEGVADADAVWTARYRAGL